MEGEGWEADCLTAVGPWFLRVAGACCATVITSFVICHSSLSTIHADKNLIATTTSVRRDSSHSLRSVAPRPTRHSSPGHCSPGQFVQDWRHASAPNYRYQPRWPNPALPVLGSPNTNDPAHNRYLVSELEIALG
ncbi:hypothetical protein K458DRAFT_142515 [Lentithecium fluviatile CBS 122367]|uniref:Uncharacterized protein n=1 Tax=Lentithecium fluviatile CBS 122367 TaxID=1168545 RepID=A0A6G1IJT0_9PLEO|nr:hypothetical protein K458DRAFT_142515 [Lentithecium fluviatile CBS 122367]